MLYCGVLIHLAGCSPCLGARSLHPSRNSISSVTDAGWRWGAASLESLMSLSAIRSLCVSSRCHHPDATVANKNRHTPPSLYLGFALAYTLVDAGGVLKASMPPCTGKLAQWLQRSPYARGEVTEGHWSQVMILTQERKVCLQCPLLQPHVSISLPRARYLDSGLFYQGPRTLREGHGYKRQSHWKE